tara:strand:- start:3728 stop:4213 length:486 start_codon:yes stop_codon:yes gene_type:complete
MTLTTLVDYLTTKKPRIKLPDYSIPAPNTDPVRQAFSRVAVKGVEYLLKKHGGFWRYGEGLLLELYFEERGKKPPTMHHFFSDKNLAIEALFKKPKHQRPEKVNEIYIIDDVFTGRLEGRTAVYVYDAPNPCNIRTTLLKIIDKLTGKPLYNLKYYPDIIR